MLALCVILLYPIPQFHCKLLLKSLWCQLQIAFVLQTQYDDHTHTPNMAFFPLSSAKWNPVFLRQYLPLTNAANNHAQWIHSGQVLMQYRGKKIHLLVALLHDLVQTQ
ncbi:hypothetical protein AVEN_52361-1 [Araneus ventricosus]|uniref:Uncharacterized protein n=1 Tax=Araneus ventricosus TaxID=182803 RepID=A0A4Y2ISM5_ARAVE|nr:hypothetical protein AVEN_52361-1 [Araneus ventricosus]